MRLRPVIILLDNKAWHCTVHCIGWLPVYAYDRLSLWRCCSFRSSDWPHDFEAAGHQGLVTSPFANVAMALSSVWYLNGCSPRKAGTWVVPYSHLDPRNPRNPDDDVHEFLPIPGELQVSAPPGSVLLQECATMLNGHRLGPICFSIAF